MQEDNLISEEELKQAMKLAVKKFNKILSNRSDEDIIVMNKLILGLLADILQNLGIEYKRGI